MHSGFKINGKPIESLLVPELSAEIRKRGGRIKSNAVKEQIYRQLLELLENEKNEDQSNQKNSKRARKTTPQQSPSFRASVNRQLSSDEDSEVSDDEMGNDDDDDDYSNQMDEDTNYERVKYQQNRNKKKEYNNNRYNQRFETESDEENDSSENEELGNEINLNNSDSFKSNNENEENYSFDGANDEDEENEYPDITSINVNELETKILNSFKFDLLIDKVYPSLGYILGKEYLRFIILKILEKDFYPCQSVKLLPPPLIYEIWTTHILSTFKYEEFQSILQFRIPHNPDDYKDTNSIIREKYSYTIKSYTKFFKENPINVNSEIWININSITDSQYINADALLRKNKIMKSTKPI